MGKIRSPNEDPKDNFWLHITIRNKATICPLARKPRKIYDKKLQCNVQGIKSSPQVRCSREVRCRKRVLVSDVFDPKNQWKSLNFFLKPAKFRLINQNHIPNFLQENDYLGKLDISQAYFHIPIKKSHRRYLAFAYAGEIFQMTALPFGLSSTPLLAFARVSKWLASYLRERGIRVLVYLNDFLFANQDPNLLEGQIKYVVNLLQSLGWCVNLQKSVVPRKQIEFLGIIWNTEINQKYIKYNK